MRPEADDPRMVAAAQWYLAQLEAGRHPDHAECANRFPDLADRLRPYLEALDLFHGTAPLLQRPPSHHEPAAPLPAEALGDFRIMREIGRGGMGVVYEAEQRSLRRRVALKVLPFAAALNPKQLARFQNEALAAAQLHHTNIVPVYAVGRERGVHYYAMQLIEGQNLADLVRQLRTLRGLDPPSAPGADPSAPGEPGPNPPPAAPLPASTRVAAGLSTRHATRPEDYYRMAAGLAVQAAEALEHAHQFGVVHRDVKPANLLVDARGNLWVTDFGLAQFHAAAGLTGTGDLLGTLHYMSPEQASGHGAPLDARTDVYSLGATLYELLTLEPLFDGEDYRQLLRLILNAEPARPRALVATVPPELETIVLKAVSKSPADRYGTAREFADDLRRFLDNRPILARRPGPVQRLRKWGRRHPSVVAAAVVLMVLLTAGSLVSAALIRAAYDRERRRAEEAEARFLLARRSVDELIQVSEEELAGKPFEEGLRRRLLELAVVYYQEFIDQRRDDPAARSELVATQDRVRRLLADLAVLQGAGQLRVLWQDAVLDDLAVTGEQRKRLGELKARLEAERVEAFADFGRLSREERRRRFLELAKADEAEVRQVLDAGQMRRLHQVAIQLRGPAVFREPEVAAALGLTPEQREGIGAIVAETFVGGPPDGPGGPGPHRRGGGGPKPHGQNLRAATENILKLLTPEQAAHWREMTGRPVDGPTSFLPP
jgi:serine/threonine protein kinase